MNAKRGFVPEDVRNFSPEAIALMRTAFRHICYLINEGYDLKHASTFVGNHYMLSERQRLALMRSAATDEQLAARREKEVRLGGLAGREVWIDGFNTIITLEVILSDSIFFQCMDGTVRDLAALRGTYRLIPETDRAVHVLLGLLEEAKADTVRILLDEPVSNSGRLKAKIADIAETFPFDVDIRIQKDVDRELYDRELVVTSDSIILDHCRSWVNLTGEYIRRENREPIRVWELRDQEGTR